MNLIDTFHNLFVTKGDAQRKPMKVQSLIFDKSKFKDAATAQKWAGAHGFKGLEVDETGNSFRLRQKDPGDMSKMRTISMTDGVKAVVGKVQKLAADMAPPSGVMVALKIPKEIADSLAIPGGEKPEDLHVTLAYIPKIGGDAEKLRVIMQAVSTLGAVLAPIAGQVGGIGKFNPSEASQGKEPFYASFSSPGLEKLRSAVLKALADCGIEPANKHGFTPHITLKYLEVGESIPAAKTDFPEFKCDTLVIGSSKAKNEINFAGTVVLKSQPGSSSVHVPSTDIEIPSQHKQPVTLHKMAAPKTAGELYQHIMDSHDNVGGTLKEGSTDGSDVTQLDGQNDGQSTTERFIFGPMTFDIDKARTMKGQEANAMAAVSPDWSHKINIDTKAALKSKSDKPVMIAQIPTTNGVEPLLIDGHHRMYKAMHNGDKEIAAHVFTPDETVELMTTTPDLMERMRNNLKKGKPMVSTENPGDGKPIDKQDPDKLEQARQDISNKTPEEIDEETADTWCARAIASFEQGDEISAELYAHEALEHASGAKDEGATVKRIEQDLRAAGMFQNVHKDTEEGTQGDISVNGFNNAGARSSGGLGDNELSGLYDMQEIVSGMDWELAHDTTDPDIAHEMALANLQDDPLHYKKLRVANDSVDWSTAFGMDPTEKGLNVDLGSGPNREPGFIGFDLVKHDHGTVVHDLHQGIPLPDRSAKNVLLRNSLHHMDELSKDPKPLLAEIQRILMPGGQLVYEGPNTLNNMPEGLVETFREKFKHQNERAARDSGRAEKIEGQPFMRQEFASVVNPDAATSNDAEPRIGVAQYDMLPADALLAMDAVGYYWSDATSSGRGNRLHGYPSQGALVKEICKAAMESTKNQPIPIFKADDEKRVVYGVVLAPNEVDLQEDWMRPDEIEKTAHYYMMNHQVIGKEHSEKTRATPVESYIAPVDIPYEGQYGKQVVKKGSWVLGVKVLNDEDWDKIKSGEYSGFSVGGWGERNDSAGPNGQNVQ